MRVRRELCTDALKCKGTVAAIEALFGTQLVTYTHTSGASVIAHTGTLSLPAELDGVVVLVEGFSRIASGRIGNDVLGRHPRPLSNLQDDNPSDDDPHKGDYLVVPQTIVEMYSLGNAKGNANVIQAAVEFVNESSYSAADLGECAPRVLRSIHVVQWS